VAGILIFYEPLPDDLHQRIEDDAEMRDVTPYEQARAILSDRYKLVFSPTGPYRPAGKRFKLRVSPKLRRRIDIEAAKNGGTIRGVGLSALASHYGLAPIDQGRRPRSPA
jgi:hypothetical protein